MVSHNVTFPSNDIKTKKRLISLFQPQVCNVIQMSRQKPLSRVLRSSKLVLQNTTIVSIRGKLMQSHK